jgi:glyoxylase-like metal-dependent hydrolase (beta-lactamase superfamily II)
MSLLVRRPGKVPLLLVGDLTYESGLLESGKIPGVGDKAELHRTSAMVRQFQERDPGLVILPAHDPGAAERLRSANA